MNETLSIQDELEVVNKLIRLDAEILYKKYTAKALAEIDKTKFDFAAHTPEALIARFDFLSGKTNIVLEVPYYEYRIMTANKEVETQFLNSFAVYGLFASLNSNNRDYNCLSVKRKLFV